MVEVILSISLSFVSVALSFLAPIIAKKIEYRKETHKAVFDKATDALEHYTSCMSVFLCDFPLKCQDIFDETLQSIAILQLYCSDVSQQALQDILNELYKLEENGFKSSESRTFDAQAVKTLHTKVVSMISNDILSFGKSNKKTVK